MCAEPSPGVRQQRIDGRCPCYPYHTKITEGVLPSINLGSLHLECARRGQDNHEFAVEKWLLDYSIVSQQDLQATFETSNKTSRRTRQDGQAVVRIVPMPRNEWRGLNRTT